MVRARQSVQPMRANRWVILLGGLGVAIYTPMFFEAVERTGVAVGTIVGVGSGPFFAGALEWVWRGVRPEPMVGARDRRSPSSGGCRTRARPDVGVDRPATPVDAAGIVVRARRQASATPCTR